MLVDDANFPNCDTLEICMRTYGDDQISQGEFEEFTISRVVSNLRTLRILGGRATLNHHHAKPLAQSPKLAQLEVLDLRNSKISTSGVQAILKSPHLENLVWLALPGKGISDKTRTALRERFGANFGKYTASPEISIYRPEI